MRVNIRKAVKKMESKYLTGGEHQLAVIGGSHQQLWFEGKIEEYEEWAGGHGYEHKEKMARWRGLGCRQTEFERDYFRFTTEGVESLWLRDLKPTLLLPLKGWRRDSRYHVPRIIPGMETERRFRDMLATEFLADKLFVGGPFPLVEIGFYPLSYDVALEKGLVTDVSE